MRQIQFSVFSIASFFDWTQQVIHFARVFYYSQLLVEVHKYLRPQLSDTCILSLNRHFVLLLSPFRSAQPTSAFISHNFLICLVFQMALRIPVFRQCLLMLPIIPPPNPKETLGPHPISTTSPLPFWPSFRMVQHFKLACILLQSFGTFAGHLARVRASPTAQAGL
jgi:hypothetical protein